MLVNICKAVKCRASSKECKRIGRTIWHHVLDLLGAMETPGQLAIIRVLRSEIWQESSKLGDLDPRTTLVKLEIHGIGPVFWRQPTKWKWSPKNRSPWSRTTLPPAASGLKLPRQDLQASTLSRSRSLNPKSTSYVREGNQNPPSSVGLKMNAMGGWNLSN